MEKINPPSKEELQELRKTKTIKEIAKTYYVSVNLVGKWLREYKLVKKLNRVVSNEHYKIAEKNGLSKRLVYHRVYKYNWDIEEAITIPKMEAKKRREGRKGVEDKRV